MNDGTEEVNRLVKSEDKGAQPFNMKLRSQAVVNRILDRSWKLSMNERYKNTWIWKGINKEE